jgi:FKBP-type peptidyl-prolyl cis-trans isomerase FklB
MLKKICISVIAFFGFAMMTYGNEYTVQTVVLQNQNDSMNYALGLVNGYQMKTYQLPSDSSATIAIMEFMDALQRGYNGEVETLSDIASIGKNIGQSIKSSEKVGLADNPAWTLNENLFFQGFVNGLYSDSIVMAADTALAFFQKEYNESATSNDSLVAEDPILGTCPSSVKHIILVNKNDSLNYAFGYLNGNGLAQDILSVDSTHAMKKEIIEYINWGLQTKAQFPQLVEMGELIGKTILEQESVGLIGEPSLNTHFPLIKQGFINGLLGAEEQMTAEEANAYIENTITTLKYGETIETNKKFHADNAKRVGVITTESGLQYEILKMGEGEVPTANDLVKVHYHGTLINGTVFDSSIERGEPITFAVTQVIAGWTEALQLMPVGSKFRLYIPHHLAYGTQQAGPIAPYSTLIFEVELLEIEQNNE